MGENPPYDLWKEQDEQRIIRHRLTSEETLKKGKNNPCQVQFLHESFVQTVAHPSVCLISVMRCLKAFRSGPVFLFVQEAFLSNDRGSYKNVHTNTTA